MRSSIDDMYSQCRAAIKKVHTGGVAVPSFVLDSTSYRIPPNGANEIKYIVHQSSLISIYELN